MSAKIFISCGQANDSEKQFAKKLSDWFEKKGFKTYVAIDAQSINDVNNSIIWNLRTADYYIFIDFKREELIPFAGSDIRNRGSLFTHQELAMSYLLGFPEVIFLQHKDLHLEGILRYILGNPRKFNDFNDAFSVVTEEIDKRNWNVDFIRSFQVELAPLSERFIYKDHSTTDSAGKQIGRDSYIQKIKVENKRVDLPALNTVARLESLIHMNGKIQSPDNSSLKWAGEQLYSKPIYESESAEFDAFGIAYANPLQINLHSARDFFPRESIICSPGKYILLYSVSAVGFPKCGIKIEIDNTGNIDPNNIKLLDYGHFDVIKKSLFDSSTGMSGVLTSPLTNSYSTDSFSNGTSSYLPRVSGINITDESNDK